MSTDTSTHPPTLQTLTDKTHSYMEAYELTQPMQHTHTNMYIFHDEWRSWKLNPTTMCLCLVSHAQCSGLNGTMTEKTQCEDAERKEEWNTVRVKAHHMNTMNFSETLWIIYTRITEPKYTTDGMGRQRENKWEHNCLAHTLQHHPHWFRLDLSKGEEWVRMAIRTLKSYMCGLWLSQVEKSCPAQCKALRVTYCSWWCQDTRTHTLTQYTDNILTNICKFTHSCMFLLDAGTHTHRKI